MYPWAYILHLHRHFGVILKGYTINNYSGIYKSELLLWGNGRKSTDIYIFPSMSPDQNVILIHFSFPRNGTVYLYNEPEKMTQASHDFRFAHSSLFLQFSSISRPQLPLWGDCYGGIFRCLQHIQSGEGNYIIKMYDWLWSPVCIYCSVCIKCKHIFIWVEISGTMSRYRLYSELTETNSLPTRYTL